MRLRTLHLFAVSAVLAVGLAAQDATAAVPLIFLDRFSHGSRVLDPEWQTLSGRMHLSGGQLVADPILHSLAVLSPVAGFSQGSLSVSVTPVSRRTRPPNFALVFGLLDSERYRYVAVRRGRVILGQEGSQALESAGVKKTAAARTAAGRRLSLGIILHPSGQTIVTINGRRVLSYAFSGGQTPGRVGLRTAGGPTRFDDFAVRGPLPTGGWSKTYGWAESHEALDAAPTPEGGLVFAGSTFAARNAWIARLDPSGDARWERTVSLSDYSEQFSAVRRTPDGGFVAAGRSPLASTELRTLWVSRLDAAGSLLWQKSYPDGLDAVDCRIEPARGGGYFVAGWSESPVRGASYDKLVRVLRLGPDGTVIWDRSFGDGDMNTASDLRALPDGGLVIAGTTEEAAPADPARTRRTGWLLRLNADGGVAWQRRYDAGGWTMFRRILATNDGLYIAGECGPEQPAYLPPPLLLLELVLIKTDAEGNLVWQRAYGTLSGPAAIEAGPAGQVLLGGTLPAGQPTNSDVWAVALDERGEVVRAASYGGAGDDVLHALVPAPDQGIWLVGRTDSFGAGWANAWVLRLEAGWESHLATQTPTVRPRPIEVRRAAGTLQPLATRASELSEIAEVRDVRSTTYRQAAPGTIPPSVRTGGASAEGGVGVAVANVHGNGLSALGWIEWGTDPDLQSFASTAPAAIEPAAESQPLFASFPALESGAVFYRAAAWNALGTQRGEIRRFESEDLPAPASPAWARTFGTAALGHGRFDDPANGLATAADGGLFVAGTHREGLGSDPMHLELRRLDRHGNLLWHRTYGKPGREGTAGLSATPDGGVVLFGTLQNQTDGAADPWLLKLQEDGRPAWQKRYPASHWSGFTTVQPTADGGFIALGRFNNSSMILKLDASGAVSWIEKLSGNTDSVLQTAEGGYFVFGRLRRADADFWALRLDSEGHRLWQRYYGVQPGSCPPYGCDDYGMAAVAAADGGFFLAGHTNSFLTTDPYVGADLLFLKISAEGDLQWQRAYGNEWEKNSVHQAVAAADGGFVVFARSDILNLSKVEPSGLARSKAQSDLLLLKMTAAGDLAWSRSYGGEGDETPAGLVRTADGGFAVSASTASFGAGNLDTLLLRTDDLGRVPGFGRDRSFTLRSGTVQMTASDDFPPEPTSMTPIETDLQPGTGTFSFVDQVAP